MDKKKKLIIASVAMVALVAGIIGTGSLQGIGIGWLRSSALDGMSQDEMARKINDNTYVVLPALEAELQELYNRKSATQRDANATPAVLNEIAANIFSAQNACDTGRVPYDTATRAVTSFEAGMSGLVSQYNGYVAARDAAQRSLNANKETIANNTKVVIPGYVAEQKKVKSTSAEYKALASQIAAVKAENTRLGKLNTDSKTGFQKQYNDAVAALKKMDLKTSEFSRKKVELERLKKVAASVSLPAQCSEVQTLRNQKAEQETLVRQSKENATSVLAGIDAEIAAVMKRKRDVENETSALHSKLRVKTDGNSGSSVSPLPNDLVQKPSIDDEYAAKWNRLSQEQEMARAARAQQLQECLDTANANPVASEEGQETPAEACERMYGSAESVESAGCGNGAIDAGACRICPMGEILDNNICTSRASFDDMLRQVREEQANQAAQAAEAAAREAAELAAKREKEGNTEAANVGMTDYTCKGETLRISGEKNSGSASIWIFLNNKFLPLRENVKRDNLEMELKELCDSMTEKCKPGDLHEETNCSSVTWQDLAIKVVAELDESCKRKEATYTDPYGRSRTTDPNPSDEQEDAALLWLCELPDPYNTPVN